MTHSIGIVGCGAIGQALLREGDAGVGSQLLLMMGAVAKSRVSRMA